MIGTTRSILTAALAADSSVPKETARAALQLLDGDGCIPAPLGRVIHASEASRLFGVTTKTLRLWADRGALVSVYGGQGGRRLGFTEASVRALLDGQTGSPTTGGAR